MAAAPKLKFTFREYLTVDAIGDTKYEYLDGLVLGMAAATPDHARLNMAVGTDLSRQLVGKRHTVFSNSLRIRAIQTGFAAHPDVTIVSDALAFDPEDNNTVTNPAVVVEVLSPSTADYDRTDKLRHYQTIAALKHIVFVAYDAPRIDVWTRQSDGWINETYGATDSAKLGAIDCMLHVDAVFRDPLNG